MLESLNVGCIPSKAILNNSHIYHQTLYDIKKRGIDGAEVTIVEFLNCVGGAGIEKEISKQFQKSLMKQHLKYKLSTKVLSAEQKDGKVAITTEAAKDGKRDSLKADVVLVANGRQLYIQGQGLENVGVEVDSHRHIVIDDQFNTSVPNIKHIGDVTFGLMLAHEGEEEGIAGVEYIHSGHGHELKTDSVKYKVGWFAFLANLRAKTNLDTEGQVKFLVEVETDWILGVHIIGPNAGEMIAKGVLALEYCKRREHRTQDTCTRMSLLSRFSPRPDHDFVPLFLSHHCPEAFREAALQVSSGKEIHF
ncbi:Dihydrolipoyl dehydrogenase mitochondrial precursor [Lactarius indigo]|nr:Dihydrolipoyl dehydrogenase mitochondrial precursor [Lactarius indigo]